jgi:hypothetical protein
MILVFCSSLGGPQGSCYVRVESTVSGAGTRSSYPLESALVHLGSLVAAIFVLREPAKVLRDLFFGGQNLQRLRAEAKRECQPEA